MSDIWDAEWWWEYGLDGVVGGLLGAVATGFAVWLTLRHERKRARLSAMQEQAGRVMGGAMNLGVLNATGAGEADEHRSLYMDLNASGWLMTSLARRDDDEFAQLLSGLLVRLSQDVDTAYFVGADDEDLAERRAEVQLTTSALAVAVGRWLHDRSAFRKEQITAEALRLEIGGDPTPE